MVVCVRCHREDLKGSNAKFRAVRATLEDASFSNKVGTRLLLTCEFSSRIETTYASHAWSVHELLERHVMKLIWITWLLIDQVRAALSKRTRRPLVHAEFPLIAGVDVDVVDEAKAALLHLLEVSMGIEAADAPVRGQGQENTGFRAEVEDGSEADVHILTGGVGATTLVDCPLPR
jgi:hypothetical protein